MTDDDQLLALFRAAASDAGAPPPAFDHDDVVAASRRIGARRAALTKGVLGVLVVAGVGAAVVLPDHSGGRAASTPVAAPFAGSNGPGSAQTAPELNRDGAAPDAGAPAETMPQSDSRSAVPPLGPGSTECADRQDPALRRYVEQALPEVVGAPEAAVTTECAPAGERGVSVEVRDAVAAGLLTVEYLPPGGRGGPVADGARLVSVPTASGGRVSVSVRPTAPGAPTPFDGRLESTAAFLAPRL